MCLRVDANGRGDGAGTHVSVHVFFMNAEYVPCMMGELRTSNSFYFTMQLVNHKSEQDPHLKAVQHVLKDTCGNDEGHATSLGYGITRFISHNDLESSSDRRQFIVNDCLTLRVAQARIGNYATR